MIDGLTMRSTPTTGEKNGKTFPEAGLEHFEFHTTYTNDEYSRKNCFGWHTWILQMDLTVTLSMITLSVSRTFGSMTQLEPMVQFLMVVFSDITLPSPTKHSDPNWKRNPNCYRINTVFKSHQARGYRARPTHLWTDFAATFCFQLQISEALLW